MSNQYKIEIAIATTYGQDGDKNAWKLFQLILESVRIAGVQHQYSKLYKGGDGHQDWDKFKEYPRNKEELQQKLEVEYRREREKFEATLVEAQGYVDKLKQQLERIDAEYRSNCSRRAENAG